VIIDVQPEELGIPTKAYYAVEEVKEVGLWSKELEIYVCLFSFTNLFGFPVQNATQKSQKVFVHVPSEIAAHEVEEIGETYLFWIAWEKGIIYGTYKL
jgi:26S proteasome regulatory subunit N8